VQTDEKYSNDTLSTNELASGSTTPSGTAQASAATSVTLTVSEQAVNRPNDVEVQHAGNGPNSSTKEADANPHEGGGQRTDALAMNRVHIDYMTTVQEKDDNNIDGGDDKVKVTSAAFRGSMEGVNHNLQGSSYEQESHQNDLSEIDGLILDFSSDYDPLDGSLDDHLDLELVEFLSEWYNTDDTADDIE
jgi:hypothetical protein